MFEDGPISEFNVHLCDIANNSFALGKKMSYEKPIRKILGSLPKRFIMKVTTIEEARNIFKMKFN